MSVLQEDEKILDYFKSEEKSMPKLRAAIITIDKYYAILDGRWIRKELTAVDAYTGATTAELRTYSMALRHRQDQSIVIQDKLSTFRNELIEKIKSVERKEEETEYLLNVGSLVYNHTTSTQTPAPRRRTGKMDDYIKKLVVSRKGEFYEEYKTMMSKNCSGPPLEELRCACGTLNNKMLFFPREASEVCPVCGITRQYVDATIANVSYGDKPPKISESGYKRINHFNEWLSQIQAKESTVIHPKIIDEVRNEFKKCRSKMKDVTPDRVQKYLKKLGYSTCYEHKVQITTIISGKPPPFLTQHQESLLRNMFHKCQPPFETCPDNIKRDPTTGKIRKNFPSYSYTLYKFSELMGYDEILKYFKLLKSTKKLQQHDRIWQYLCGQLGWQFIKSSSMKIRAIA